jgi:hypothetical protein
MTLKKRIKRTFFFAGLLFCFLVAPVKTMAQNLNFEQLRSLAIQAGFEPDIAPTIAAISLAESGGNPNAHNPVYPDDSYGLMQINMLDEPGYPLGAERRARYGLDTNEQLKDPLTNMRAAKDIYDRQGLNAWSVYRNNSHLDFFPKSEMPGTNYNAETISRGSMPVANTGSSNRDEAKPMGPNEASVMDSLKDLSSFVMGLIKQGRPETQSMETTREEQMRSEEMAANKVYQDMIAGSIGAQNQMSGQDVMKNAIASALDTYRL